MTNLHAFCRRQRRLHHTHRSSFRPEVTQLEDRVVPTGGTWTALTNFGGGGTMMLLSDGSVMIQGGGISSSWSRLTPNSSGSYVNGTFSSLASMSLSRLYFASNVLPDGRVFVYGGEYSNGSQNWTNTGEIYNPVNNTWTNVPSNPFIGSFGDDPSAMLPDGTVMCGYLSGPQTYIYNPTTNSWSQGATKLLGDRSDEETWVKLADGSILSYDIFASQHAQKYIPSLQQWVDAGTLPAALQDGLSELGPALLLPDGRAFFVGASGHTALYTPGANVTDPGSWAAGPDIPGGLGAVDAPGAMLPNGDVIFAASPSGTYNAPTTLFEYDPSTNSLTTLSTPSGLTSALNGDPGYVTRMLVLPTGQVLFSTSGSQLWAFTPNGSPQAAWAPTISSITNSGSTYTLTGTQLNGLSEGASYGDDAEMSSNYPIVRLVSGSQVYYARTFNWSSTGVATGSTPETVNFTVPGSVPNGTYSLYVVANGIASAAYSFSYNSGTTQTATSITVSPTSASVALGGTQQFTATELDQNGSPMATQPTFVWASSNSNVGTISSTGLFTATGGGSATITASADGLNGTASVSVLTAPAAPSNLTATGSTYKKGRNTNDQVTLKWQDNSSNATSYTIQRSSTFDVATQTWINWGTVATLNGSNVTSYTDRTVSKKTPYAYRVFAANSVGSSPYSNIATVTTPKNPGGGPTNVDAQDAQAADGPSTASANASAADPSLAGLLSSSPGLSRAAYAVEWLSNRGQSGSDSGTPYLAGKLSGLQTSSAAHKATGTADLDDLLVSY